jgi:hypothetical protein
LLLKPTPFRMKKIIYSGMAMLLSIGTMAQITFSNGAGLQTISGFSYADCAADMNGDHLDDVVRVTGGTIYIDYQQADGSFLPASYSIAGDNVPSWSICAADIDGNGYTDLCFGDGNAVSFVYANNDGTGYTEVAHPEYIFSQRSTFQDIDNDGNLDAFVCHDVDQSHAYRNTDGVLDLDISLLPTLDAGGNYAAIWVDYDNDWDSDLYITKCRGGAPVGDPQRINLLYRNNGDGTFTSVGPEANMDDGDQSWATVFEDFDNDGDFDSFTVNHQWANRFMQNNGDGTFTDIIENTGINALDLGAWNCDAGDFDNNGFVDIFSEMGTEMYWNNGDGTFTGGNLSVNSGGIGDFNDDGFLDVIAGNTLHLNNGNNNNYVKFDLQGIMSNKDGIGARIEIYGSWGVQIREVRAGESFDPASSLIAHFGLGTADAIEYAVIKWPSGMLSTLDAPAINTTHLVPEVGCMLPESTINVDGLTTICPGDEVTLTAQTGYAYTWSNGEESQSITVAEAGSYSVIIWDEDDCASLSNLVVISEVQEVTPTISLTGESVFCYGSSVVLTCEQGTGTWSNGQTSASLVVTEGGEYSISVAGQCSGIELTSESITLVTMDAEEPVSEDVILSEPGTTTLNATGNNLSWYATETSTEVLGTGNSFETDVVTTSLSYWVEATEIFGGEVQTGGKPDNAGTGGLPSSGGRLFFNITEPCTLAEVTAYIPVEGVAGMRTVQLYDGNGTLLDEVTVNCEIGENLLSLGFDLSVGDYQIGCAENNLFRNSSGVTFPYSIGTMGTINTTTNGASYYYYFYNWQVQKPSFECTSDRIEVMATVVGIEELASVYGIGLFPNPTSETLNITIGSKFIPTNVEVTNADGRVVLKTNLNAVAGQNSAIDVNKLAAGLYHVVLTDGKTFVSTDFIKN